MNTISPKSVTIATAGATTEVATAEGDIVFVGTIANQTFTKPAQQIQVGNFPSTNPQWFRGVRLSSEAIFLLRNGVDGVALLITSLVQMALAIVNGLSWAPRITTQPVSGTVVADSSHIDFTVVATSETALTYAWKESADGVTYGSALTTTGIYDVSVAGRLRITPAQAFLTSDNTNVANNDTVTIGSKVYTFKTALTPTEGEVLIGADADGSLLNLIRAINHTGTPDTDYKCAAVNADVTADAAVTAHKMRVAPKAAGTVVTTETSGHLGWTAGSVVSKTGYYYRCTLTNATGSTDTDEVVMTTT